MRTWVYSYKTSDGLRHEDEISAESKDAAFSLLRERGIRAIRVDEKIAPVVYSGLRGLRRRHYLILSLIVAGVSAVVVALAMVAGRQTTNKVPTDSVVHVSAAQAGAKAYSCEFQDLIRASETLREQHRKAESTIDTAMLSDLSDLSGERVLAVRAEIEKGRAIVDVSRANIKKTFYPLYKNISAANGQEQIEAQRLYGQLMEEVDATEDWLDASEKFFKLVLDEY